MRIAIFDYGAGNLHSLRKALALTGVAVTVETDIARCLRENLVVLPGVGAFGQAAARLAPARASLRDALRDGLPAIGICLGMQLLLDGSDESPGEGLGIVRGRVRRLTGRRVPHIGWNALDDTCDPAVLASGLRVPYYANSYACEPENRSVVTAWCEHEGCRFPAMIRTGRVVGVQFHPEKSGAVGAGFLATLVREALCS